MSDLKDTALELAAAGLELANKRIRELESERNNLALKHHEQAATAGKLRDMLDECESVIDAMRQEIQNLGGSLEGIITADATLAKLRAAQEKADE